MGGLWLIFNLSLLLRPWLGLGFSLQLGLGLRLGLSL